MPNAIPIISAFHNLSAGDLADEHGHLSGQIADLETRKRAIAGKVIRRGVSECEGALFRSVLIGKAMVCTLDRAGIEEAMGKAWVARFLKWSKALGTREDDGPHRRCPAGRVREGGASQQPLTGIRGAHRDRVDPHQHLGPPWLRP